MSRTLLCRMLKVVVLLVPIGVALASCSIQSDVNVKESNQNTRPMIPSSPSHLPPGPVVYVALGDSTGSGVGAREGGYVARLFKRLEAYRPGSKLINLCFSGATTSDVLREQLDSGVRSAPQLVTVGIGINDIGHGVSLEQFSRNYEQILARIKSDTAAIIVITNIPDISSAPRIPAAMRVEYQQQIIQFNGRLAEIAARHGAVVFDVYTFTHEQLPLHPEYFSGDGFHPSDKGYELWAEEMWPTIAKIAELEPKTTGTPR